ncbi:MAG: cupredoxin domain-containing protein [Nitrosopumilaceae archaeon]
MVRARLAGFIIITVITFSTVYFTSANAQENKIPDWVKGVTGWWAEGKISESEFINAMEFLINEGIIKPSSIITLQDKANELQARLDAAQKRIISLEQQISEPDSGSSSDNNTADSDLLKLKISASSWGKSQISDADYFNEIQKLVDNGTIKPFDGNQNKNPETNKEPIPRLPSIHTFQFPFDTSEPKHLTIYLGDTVKWINSDDESHTVTSGTKEIGYDGKFFDRLISPNESTNASFSGTGTFTFFCRLYNHNENLVVDVIAEYRQVTVPQWVRDNAKWWGEGTIVYSDYRAGLAYLYENGFINNP